MEKIHEQLRGKNREQVDRQSEPTVSIIDSQSVKTVATAILETKGYDVYKATKGRKRHLLVDSMELILAMVVTAANVTDRNGALLIFDKIRSQFPQLSVICADQAYSGEEYTSAVQQPYHRRFEIIKRSKPRQGFQMLPSRWVVERTFGWLSHFRRLSKDYERQLSTSKTFIEVAMISIMLRRLA